MQISDLQDIEINDFSTWPIWLRWIGIISIALGILFLGYKYFIKPEQIRLAELQRIEQTAKQTFMQKKELVINLPAYIKQMEEIEDRFGVVLQQLPDKTEIPALLIDISQVGLVRGLNFQLFKPGAVQTGQFYISMPISIIVSGKFHQLAEFISDLSALPRIVTVNDMTITKNNYSYKDKDKDLKMEAQLNTYQYLEAKESNEAGQELEHTQG